METPVFYWSWFFRCDYFTIASKARVSSHIMQTLQIIILYTLSIQGNIKFRSTWGMQDEAYLDHSLYICLSNCLWLLSLPFGR